MSEGLFGPSVGLTPTRCALRGQPSAVQICSGQICRTIRVFIGPLSPPPIKKRPCGRFGERGIVRPIRGPHPYALRAPGPAFGCPNLFQTNLSNHKGSHRTSLSATHKKTPMRAFWRERAGLFGPSVGLSPTRCALRGQPSAVQICSRQICRTIRVLIGPLSPPPIKKTPMRAFFYGWRRERDSNPR